MAVTEEGHDSALSVHKMQDCIWRDGRPMNYGLECVPRTKDLDPLFVKTAGLYICKRDLIVQKNRRIGESPYLAEVSRIEALGVNEPVDFEIIDAVLAHGLVLEE